MTEKAKALKLADALDAYWGAESGHEREREAATELRRLHKECEHLFIEREHARIMYERFVAPQPEQEPAYWQWRRKQDDWQVRMIFSHEVRATTEDSEVRTLYTTPPQRKPLTDEAAMFAAQHMFLEWNRRHDERLVKVAYEYGVFQKAIELYNEAYRIAKGNA